MAIATVLATLGLRPDDSAAATLLLAVTVLGVAALVAVLLAARPAAAALAVAARTWAAKPRVPLPAADPQGSGHVRARAPGVVR